MSATRQPGGCPPSLLVGLVGLVGLLAAAGPAAAQVGTYRAPGAALQPGYSPYLNLARPGNAAVNYYGLVRPQVEFRQSIQNVEQQVTGLSQSPGLAGQGPADIPSTGHPAQFLNTGGYFPTQPGPRVGFRIAGGGGSGQPAAGGFGAPALRGAGDGRTRGGGRQLVPQPMTAPADPTRGQGPRPCTRRFARPFWHSP